MFGFLASLLLAYLIGSIPTSYIFAKFIKRIDIRQHGSGNVGATNVFRVVGKGPAIIVLFVDMLKGVVSAAFLCDLFFNNTIGVTIGLELYRILVGVCAITGHVYSAFLGFKGGKGVATTAGVLLILSPKVVAASALVWAAVFGVFRIVSIASIAASVFLPIFAVIFRNSISLVIFTVVLCIMGTYKHKSNIRRLMRGEEKRLI